MRNVSADWIEYIETTTTKTLVKCLRVETLDHTVYGTTTHTRDFVFEGVTYYTSAGLTDTAVARTEGFGVDNMEFSMVLTDAMHAAIEAGKFDEAKCYFFMVDYTDLTKGSVPLSTGYIGEITRDGNLVKAEILGLMSRLGRKTGRVYTTECDAVLGDSRCKVPMKDIAVTTEYVLSTTGNTISRTLGIFSDHGLAIGDRIQIAGSGAGNDGIQTIASFVDENTLVTEDPIFANETATLTLTKIVNRIFSKTVATVSALSPRRIFTMNSNTDTLGNTLQDHWCFAGVVEFLTGDNAGEKRDVSSHIGVDIECYLEFPYDIVVGDSFTISTGCDLLVGTCKTKFDNIENMRGFPFSPSNEDIFYSPAQAG